MMAPTSDTEPWLVKSYKHAIWLVNRAHQAGQQAPDGRPLPSAGRAQTSIFILSLVFSQELSVTQAEVLHWGGVIWPNLYQTRKTFLENNLYDEFNNDFDFLGYCFIRNSNQLKLPN